MIKFKIVTPYGVTYDDTIEKVTIPTQAGEITVLENHTPLVSILAAGELIIYKEGYSTGIAISGGFFEIRPNSEVYIMADTAEHGTEIDIERAEAAQKRAEELLRQVQSAEDVDYARLQAAIEKELVRISVGRKYKNVGGGQ